MTYAFGDTDLALERLGLVADTFEAPSRALLGDLPAGGYRHVPVLDDGKPVGIISARDVLRFMTRLCRDA